MSALPQELGEPAETPRLSSLPTGRRARRLEHRHQLRLELGASAVLAAAVCATAIVLLAAR